MAGFDVVAEAYDAMINWEKRLANERPLFRWVFERAGAKSVLDAACGSGRHAAMFASWGLEVEGADLSAEMIAHCRREHGERPGLSWVQRSFTEPAAQQRDVVICTGNSLALAQDPKLISEAIAAMAASARRGLMIHVVNLYVRENGPAVWDKTMRVALSTGEHLLHKGIHRCNDVGYVDFLLTSLADFSVTTRCVPFAGLRADVLEAELRRHGFASVQCFGGYGQKPFDERASSDLIAVALR